MMRSYLSPGGRIRFIARILPRRSWRVDLVVTFDNLPTGRLRNLNHLWSQRHLTLVHGSVHRTGWQSTVSCISAK